MVKREYTQHNLDTPLELEQVATPGVRTIADLSACLDVEAVRSLKHWLIKWTKNLCLL